MVGVQEGKVKLQNKTKNTVDTAQLFIVTATLVSRYCNVGVKFDISMLKPQFEVDISNTYQNSGSQHHGKNTQDSLNCLRSVSYTHLTLPTSVYV